MNTSANTKRFIPFRKSDLVTICLGEGRLSGNDRDAFRSFCRILESVFHFEFQHTLETLKECYAPFNMDLDTRTVRGYSAHEKAELQKKLVSTMTDILRAANYREITPKDLKDALSEESLFNIRLEVNFDDFEDVIFYMRGENRKKETLVKYWGLKKEPFEFTNYERVAVYIKFKDASYFADKKLKNLYFTPGATIIKLFKNVPKADLEMLFPNSEVRMKTIDKLIIGLPAAVSGAMVVATKLGASLLLIGSVVSFWLGLTDQEVVIDQHQLIALGLGLGTLAGFLFKQYIKFKNRKIQFMKALTDSLYFKNLDNNQGVFHHLIDDAEEEEFKEAMLAYYFLLTEPQALTLETLDQAIESWFQTTLNCSMDFEVGDAVGKLRRLNLIEEENGILRAKSIQDARRILDHAWDNFFEYNDGKEKGQRR